MHVVTLRDPSSPLVAQFVPDAGMIGTSLRDAGAELLGQRRGLDAYISDGKTMGIPSCIRGQTGWARTPIPRRARRWT